MADAKERVRRLFEEAVNGDDASVADELLSDDYVNHDFGGPGGRESFKQVMAQFRGAFPDLRIEVEHRIAEANAVAQVGRWSGTHRGDFMGMSATGRRATIRVMDFVRLRDGVVVDHWNIVDVAGLMQQLGLMGGDADGGGPGAGPET